MEVKSFYKNQKEVALSLNKIIDQYFNNIIDETSLKKLSLIIIKNNSSKVYKNNNFTTVISQRCGKRRLELLEKLIKNEIGGADI